MKKFIALLLVSIMCLSLVACDKAPEKDKDKETETNAPVGSYVLQNKSEGVAFYYVEEGAQPKVKANRAYLTVPAAANVRALFFGDDEATAIEGLGALTEGDIEGIYSANGVKVGALQKGVNIIKRVDGSSFKVMVK